MVCSDQITHLSKILKTLVVVFRYVTGSRAFTILISPSVCDTMMHQS